MPERPREEGLSIGAPADRARAVDLGAPANLLRALRAAAREVAARALAERGFVALTAPDGDWTGTLFLPRSVTTLPVTVRLTESFPDALPKVSVSPDHLPRRIAHVEGLGNICVVPSSNMLLDADRPQDLIAEVLSRATDVLDRGLLGETDADLDAEFQAYWVPTESRTVLSLCDADGPARQIVVCELTSGSKLINQSWMVVDDLPAVEAWADHVGAKIGGFRGGLFLPLSASLPLARLGEPTTVAEVAQLITRHGTPAGQDLFRDAIQQCDYPLRLVMSMPEASLGAGRRLAALLIKRPDQRLLNQAARGFRRGRVPAARLLSKIGREAVGRLRLNRVDLAYLAARGGAATHLARATVTVVGVGAVGSEVARNLASLGVGHIRLVDPDEMNPENVHRHALGMSSTGYTKVVALMVDLGRSFPHLDIDGRVTHVEALIAADPAYLLDADLVVLATGEETLERRLNRLLLDGPPRVHTWLEPLGVAGHAFACGGRDTFTPGVRPGCFECLYRPDQVRGLINRTALTAPGQEIRRSLAGCAGTFSPFSPLDARRTAIEAAELVARVLTGAVLAPALVSWRGMHSAFEAAGYRLSVRASQIMPGARVEVEGGELANADCTVCSAKAGGTATIPTVA